MGYLITKPSRKRPKSLDPEGRDDVRARIKRANLSKRDRFIIESYFGLDRARLTIAEIAEQLGIHEHTISKQRAAIWDKLAQMWD